MSEVYTALTKQTPEQQVTQAMEDLRKAADRREQALRLLNNRDFQSLIMEFYCVKEAARAVQFSGQPGASKDDRQHALEMAQATGHFKRFIDVTVRMGEQAVVELGRYNQEYSELVREEEE